MTEEKQELEFRRAYVKALADRNPSEEMKYKTNHEYPLNGYEMMAQDYEKMLHDKSTDEYFDAADARDVEMKIKALRTVARLNEEEIDALFDTSAFNSIVKGYLWAAMEQTDPELTEEQKNAIAGCFSLVLSEMSAWDARRKYVNNLKEGKENE